MRRSALCEFASQYVSQIIGCSATGIFQKYIFGLDIMRVLWYH
jgi:hypothetical protein